ncbi:GNAT family N-acetyltransferase [Phyllobacterium sp. 628]|uniref:GNAT family N-acetyltransferase n=1 Tax=Phyllobacterium sp. 628 TaxID=2718938 RepID=UPI001662451B|nr:GNAT family protein [Phyllobacterium sp. 628]QND53119.1 GNAT family N-acetyltransferase [Phyllobacterium sp. 628]
MEPGQLVTLDGERVFLRRPHNGDAQVRLALGHDLEIYRMFGGSREELSEMTSHGAAMWVESLAEHPYAWVIEHESLIGEIRLDHVNLSDRRASLAIGIYDPALLGHGLGSEAIKLVLAYAFDVLGLHRIGLRVLAYNQRAIRAYEKCGFVIEGRERDAAFVDGAFHDDIMMGVLEQEFQVLNRC